MACLHGWWRLADRDVRVSLFFQTNQASFHCEFRPGRRGCPERNLNLSSILRLRWSRHLLLVASLTRAGLTVTVGPRDSLLIRCWKPILAHGVFWLERTASTPSENGGVRTNDKYQRCTFLLAIGRFVKNICRIQKTHLTRVPRVPLGHPC